MLATLSLEIIGGRSCLEVADTAQPMAPRRLAASPKLLDCAGSPAATRGRMAASWTQCGATIGPCPVRYVDGVSPTISRNVRLNVPRLVKPTRSTRRESLGLAQRNIDASTRRLAGSGAASPKRAEDG